MSAEPAPSAPVETICPLCGAPVEPAALRCDSCGMTLDGTAGRPAMFSRRTLWLWAGALLLIYLIVLAVVATVHD